MIRLARFSPRQAVWAKAELLHPSGSAYDRIARPLLERAGDVPAVVAGAGSVCLAFCRAAALLRRDVTVVCPQSTVPEHLELLSQHAAHVETSPRELGLLGAHLRAQEIVEREGRVLLFSVRVTHAAAELFADSLGEELVDAFERIDPKPAHVVAPVAAGALLGGVGLALARAGFHAELVGVVRPDVESLQDGTVEGSEVLDEAIVKVAVSDREAFETRLALARTEGMLVGMGSAAAVRVAVARAEPSIAIVVDAGDRYFSVDRRLTA